MLAGRAVRMLVLSVAAAYRSSSIPRQRCVQRDRCPILAMTSTFEHENPFVSEMTATARRIARRGHGILATDESTPTAGKRLETIGVENTEANRREYRDMLYSTPNLGDHISGVIMTAESLYQRTEDNVRFVDVLQEKGIVVGIKVDTGLQVIAGSDGETATMGLDGLGNRCKAYYAMGARFAKWRAVFKIGVGMPSERAVVENAQALARYANICQVGSEWWVARVGGGRWAVAAAVVVV